MSKAMLARQLKEYSTVNTHSDVATASPHRLIQMLLEGGLEKLAIAKGHMEQGNRGECGRHISWAISIIEGLRMSLDKAQGGAIAENLDALYEYMGRRLLSANIKQDITLIEEVMALLLDVKVGWDGIENQV